MKTNEITKFLKKNQKPLLVVLGVIVVIVAVWIIVKKLTTGKDKKKKTEDLTGQSVTPGLNFDDLAIRMFRAWITTWGTDENEVYSILGQLNNQADWEYLKVKYEEYWDSLPWYEQILHNTAGLGLSGVLVSDFRRELDKTELQHCRGILTEKDINPGF